MLHIASMFQKFSYIGITPEFWGESGRLNCCCTFPHCKKPPLDIEIFKSFCNVSERSVTALQLPHVQNIILDILLHIQYWQLDQVKTRNMFGARELSRLFHGISGWRPIRLLTRQFATGNLKGESNPFERCDMQQASEFVFTLSLSMIKLSSRTPCLDDTNKKW